MIKYKEKEKLSKSPQRKIFFFTSGQYLSDASQCLTEPEQETSLEASRIRQ